MNAAPAARPTHSLAYEHLLAALQVECRLLETLADALARQRAGVAADDSAQVDAATHAVSRSLLTIEEAGRRRGELVEVLGGTAGGGLESLERVLGPNPRLTEARNAIRTQAQRVIRDLAMNQTVLHKALRSGEAYLQAMLAPESSLAPGYGTGRESLEPPARGVLLNKSA